MVPDGLGNRSHFETSEPIHWYRMRSLMHRSVLSIRPFRNLWVGQLISQFGDVLYSLVFMWMVLEKTGDPKYVGYVMAFGAAPYVLFSLYAGTLADRLDRRMLLIVSDVLSAVLVIAFMFIILAVESPPLIVICAVAFLLGTSNVIAAPARAAITPRLVPESRLQEAIAFNSMSQGMMPFIGALLSGFGLALLQWIAKAFMYSLAFALNAVTFIISAFFMATLPEVVAERADEPKSPLRDAIEGIKFIFTHKALAIAILIAVGMNFFVAPFMPVYTYIAKEVFEGTPATLAFLEAGFFLGMVVGSILAMRLRTKRPGLAFALFLMLAGLTIIPMGFTSNFWLFMGLNFLCGVLIPPANIPMGTFIQLQTDDAYRGRVNSAMGTMAAMVMPIGMAMSGLLLSWLTLPGLFIFMGGGMAMCASVGFFSKSLRTSTLPSTDQSGSEDPPALESSETAPSSLPVALDP